MSTEDKFCGECKRGPHHGQMWAYPSKRMPVFILDGLFIHEGVYEFFDGVWIWNGPTVRGPSVVRRWAGMKR
jgi:hypothetical protein